MIELRPYQRTAIDALRGAYRAGKRRPLLCAPTGSGKSAMTAYMLGRTSKRTLYLCHRDELMGMISDDLTRAGIAHGLIGSTTRTADDGPRIDVGMVQTVARRLDRLPDYEFVVSDEAHLAMAKGWLSTLRRFDGAHHLGMSATPCRLDGRGLGEFFDDIVHGPTIRELTALGYLAPYRAWAPPVDLAGVRQARGEYVMQDAAERMGATRIVGDAVAEYRKRADGLRALAFCCTVRHAEAVAARFAAAGIPAAHVDGAMDHDLRRERIAAFRRGELLVLANVDLLTTGFDCPEIDALIFLRPTQSLALYMQMVGRVLRIAPGKLHARLLDHAGVVMQHGLPDMAREWTLDGRLKRDTAAPAARQCPECWAVFPPARVCPSCGHEFDVKATRGPKEHVAGDLVEITAQPDLPPLREAMRGVRTMADLRRIGRERGYKPSWAAVVAGKMRLRPAEDAA